MIFNDSCFYNFEIQKHSAAILTDLIKLTIVGALVLLSATGMHRTIRKLELCAVSQDRINALLFSSVVFIYGFPHLINYNVH